MFIRLDKKWRLVLPEEIRKKMNLKDPVIALEILETNENEIIVSLRSAKQDDKLSRYSKNIWELINEY